MTTPAGAQTTTRRAARPPVEKAQTSVRRKRADDATSDGAAAIPPYLEERLGSATSDAEQRIRAARGGGDPLPGPTREKFEAAFGEDFGAVRVHTAEDAQELSAELEARAFTVGDDIFFAAGEYAPDVEDGQRLLAHELTHVAQGGDDSGGVLRAERAGKPKGAKKKGDAAEPEEEPGHIENGVYVGPEGTIDEAHTKATLREAHFPKLKEELYAERGKTANLELEKTERTEDQRQVWRNEVNKGDALGQLVDAKLKKAPAMSLGGDPCFYLSTANGIVVMGSRDTIVSRVAIPYWNANGTDNQFYHVDHKVELQTGGEQTADNLWLLGDSENMSSGSRIANELERRLVSLLQASEPLFKRRRYSVDALRKSASITIETLVFDTPPKKAPSLSLDDITKKGLSLTPLKVLSKREIARRRLQGSPNELSIASNPSGGRVRHIKWDENKPEQTLKDKPEWVPDFRLTSITYHHDKPDKNSVTGEVFKDNKYIKGKSITVDLHEQEGIDWGGYASNASLRQQTRSILKANGFSPITIEDISLEDRGIVATGFIEVDLPLLKGTRIGLEVAGPDVTVSKVFTADEFHFPGPIQVTQSSLAVKAGTRGFGATGEIQFAIGNLGTGKIEASAKTKGTGGEVSLAGQLDLDLSFLDEASVNVKYENDTWSGKAHLGFKPGTLPGVKKGAIDVGMGPEGPTIVGSAELGLPGFEGVKLTAGYDRERGLILEARDIPLPTSVLPGVSGGSAFVTVARAPDGRWHVSGGGSAQIDFRALKGSIAVAVDGDRVELAGNVQLEQGFLKGGASLTVTNAPLDADGKPMDGPPRKEYSAWGSGFATVRFGKYLTGTIGVNIKPDGGWNLVGDIALPPVVEIIPAIPWEPKELFKIPDIKVTIFGIPHIADVFLFFGAGLKFEASVGPGTLEGAHATIHFDPEKQEETTVHGEAKFNLPAYAGLVLDVHGGLGGELPLVEARASAVLEAKIGALAKASAGVAVDWTPTQGLSIELKPPATITVSPVFEFSGRIEAKVWIDYWVGTKTLVHEKWPLFDKKIPSDLSFGVSVPAKWSEQNGLEFDIDDIKLIPEKPDIDLGKLCGDLADAVIDL